MALTASTWKPINVIGLNQEITETSTTQKYDIGFRVRCRDVSSQNRGIGEFVYLLGVASTAAYDAVVFDQSTGAITRTLAASKGPFAVIQSALTANLYGWGQVHGLSLVTAGTVVDNAAVYTTATDGSLDDTQVDSSQVLGAIFRAATDTGQAVIELNYPNAGADDQVT